MLARHQNGLTSFFNEPLGKQDPCIGALMHSPTQAPPVAAPKQESHKPATRAMKEALKLRKALHSVVQIEERLAAGERIDPLQRKKLERKQEFIIELAQAEHAVEQEDPQDEDPQFEYSQQVSMHSEAVEPRSEVQGWAAPSASTKRRQRRQRAVHSGARCADMGNRVSWTAECDSGLDAEGLRVLEALKAGGEAQAVALNDLRGSMLQHAFTQQGCRAVQLAIEEADIETLAELLRELHGHVADLIDSPHANYVIQKVVQFAPAALARFVALELHGVAIKTARHRYGCRIMCRLLEHCSGNTDLAVLLEELLAETAELSRHAFAHFVVESILEHGPLEQRGRIAMALLGDLPRHAHHRCASHVVTSALIHCGPEDQCLLASALLNTNNTGLGAASLAQSQFGSFVVRELLRAPGSRRFVWEQLQRSIPQLNACKQGARLLRDLGLRTAAAAA